MKDVSRRKLLAAGPGLTALGAGCLDGGSGDDETRNESDGTTEQNDGGGDLTPLERWVPASGSAELLVHYRDLAAVRRYEDDLDPEVAATIPTLPDGMSGELAAQLSADESDVDAVLRFGSKGTAGNVVLSGSFDPGAIDDSEPAVGEFERFERDAASVAVSSDALVVSGDDGAELDAVLSAGVEGTDRRVDAADRFADLAETTDEATFLWGEHDAPGEDAAGTGIAYSWTVGADTTVFSATAAVGSDRTAEFERKLSETVDDATVETDGAVVVAERSIPTEDYEFQDLFAERGTQPAAPQAGVSIDVDSTSRTVTVAYVSRDRADRIEIRDGNGNTDELTAVGQTTTFDYDAGATGTITVVAVRDGAEAVVATKPFSFD
ncbi:hypothetical protein [Natrinema salifodinae]|uniref:Uncharacterized protein n=1 Tax=Natrinema salifodinae TaxID=1202768 RepID=A0A1I0N131_9EURY|nr:hypothetical protein [Natrinema salifodinae]SEV94457.1 hypothetical protein SAMN05216285_1202 [Natrinema salifodinae]